MTDHFGGDLAEKRERASLIRAVKGRKVFSFPFLSFLSLSRSTRALLPGRFDPTVCGNRPLIEKVKRTLMGRSENIRG